MKHSYLHKERKGQHYYEDPDTRKYIQKLEKGESHAWIRRATRTLMEKELKKKWNQNTFTKAKN